MDLWADFQTNQGKLIHKWPHYFPIYERHFARLRNTTMTMIEIGVSEGGSLQMWQRFFGPMATIVGIDLSPGCAKHQGENVHVRIGDQSDAGFLQSVLDEFGTPDIVLDDGSHVMGHIAQTFEFLYPRVAKNGIYAVEDLHTAYWPEFGGNLDDPQTFINRSKAMVDKLNARHSRGKVAEDFFSHNTFGISFYDSVVVFERGTLPLKNPIKTGGRAA